MLVPGLDMFWCCSQSIYTEDLMGDVVCCIGSGTVVMTGRFLEHTVESLVVEEDVMLRHIFL
jgi:hypothetical protein